VGAVLCCAVLCLAVHIVTLILTYFHLVALVVGDSFCQVFLCRQLSMLLFTNNNL